MAFRIERQLALSEEKLKCLCELRDQAYDQICKIMMFTVSCKGLTEKFEAIRTDLLEQAKELALQERKFVEESNLLEQREKEAEIRLRRTDEEIQVKEAELSSIKTRIQDTLAEFNLREKQLNECDIELTSKKQKVEESNRELSLKKEELGLVKMNLEECRKDLSLKKDQLHECSRELQMKEKGLDSIKTQIEDFSVEVDSKQKHLNLVQEEIEKCNSELNLKKEELEVCNREIFLKNNDLSKVQMSLERCTAELETVISIKDCEKELDLKRKEENQVQTLIEGSKKEYDLLKQKMSQIRKSMEERSKELDSKKLEFNSIKQLIGEYNEELEYKEKKYDVMKNSVDEVAEMLKLKERELKLIEKSLNEKSEKLRAEEEKLDSIQKYKENVEKKLNSLKGAVKHHEDCQKELELDKELLRSVKLRIKNSTMELESIKKLITECSGKLESKERNLDVVKKSLEGCCNELTSKEVQQGVIHVMCCENLRELQEQKTYYDSLKRTMEEREEELQNRERQLEEKVKMLESMKKKKRDGIPFVDLEQLDCSHSNPACSSSANSHFNASASEKSPELFLDDIVSDPNLTIDEISNGLQFSPDPAKLVLDVMRGSYFQFQDKGSAGFDDCLMTNIVLLLERLMKISPKISLQVKEIALQQGVLWKDNINSKTQNSIEVLAFLMFLAVYDLVSNFRRDEILILVKTIVHHKQAPEICRTLCSIDEIAGLTANLIQSKQFPEAARFSKIFELSSKFLPQNILRNYLENIKMDVLLSINSSNSFQGQFKTMDKEAVALRTFWQCVIDCQLESVFSLESCMHYIAGRLAHPFSDSPHMSQQPLEGHMAQQQPMQSRNPYMVSASNPSYRPFLGTGKRPRLDSMVFESHQGSIPPSQYHHRGGYFRGPN